MILKGNETFYNKAKNKTPELSNSVAALLSSDVQLNSSIADYIVLATRTQTILDVVKNIVSTDHVDESSAVGMIAAILGVKL